MKFQNSSQEKKDLIKLYNNKVYIPENNSENSIFYFVREPAIKSFNSSMSKSNLDDYIQYLNFMEGSAKSIKLQNFCFEATLIMDGSFTIPLNYDEHLEISSEDRYIRTLGEFL
jgi:hypothetical protein